MAKRHTRQERVLMEALGSFDAFFTADELAGKAQGKPRIGIATVYRFLKSRERSGEVHPYFCGRRRLYSVKEDSHCHFTCSECGRVEHFRPKKIDFIKDAAKGRVCHFQLDIAGVCKRCLKKSGEGRAGLGRGPARSLPARLGSSAAIGARKPRAGGNALNGGPA